MFLSIGPVSKSGWRYKAAQVFCNVMPFAGDTPSKSFCFFFHQVWIGGLISLIFGLVLLAAALVASGFVYASYHAMFGAMFGFSMGPVPDAWPVAVVLTAALYLVFSFIKREEHFEYCNKRYLKLLIQFNFDKASLYKYLVEHNDRYVVTDCDYVRDGEPDEDGYAPGRMVYTYHTMEEFINMYTVQDAYVRFVTYPWVRHFLLRTLRLGYFFPTPEEKKILDRKVKEEEKTKEPSMLAVYWSSVKNKVCPQIEYVD